MNIFKQEPSNKSFLNESIKSFSNTPIQNISSSPISNTSTFSIKKISIYLLIILILAFLGFNIFTYLSDGTEYLKKLLAPLSINLANKSGDVAKTTTDSALKGTKKILDVGVDTTTNILDTTKEGTDSGINYIQKKLKNTNTEKKVSEPEPISTSSYKQGFCFIGKINDTRYCAKVTSSDQCMSGEIFPSENECINPNSK